MLTIIPGPQIDGRAWDDCVSASSQRIIYGYSWYLNAVLPAPEWKWAGIVLKDEICQYRAVMPVPLRRKTIFGLSYEWVVHQPFFCQFLGIFSRDEQIDPQPFFQLMMEQFRYGSIFCTRQEPGIPFTHKSLSATITHTLSLAIGYQHLYQNYTRDRRINLRRGLAANWTIMDSTDPQPLLALFQDNHADAIAGGVAEWAYDIIRNLIRVLQQRDLATLRYAVRNNEVEAGALFMQEGSRIIYLFNAASPIGRKGNARTLLIDQLIQEKAGQPLILDFESPDKQSIRTFYQSFGASEETFWEVRWNRLNLVERALLEFKHVFMTHR